MTLSFVVNPDYLPKDPSEQCIIVDISCDTHRVMVYYENNNYYSYVINKTKVDSDGRYVTFQKTLAKGPKSSFIIELINFDNFTRLNLIDTGYNGVYYHDVALPLPESDYQFKLDYTYGCTYNNGEYEEEDPYNQSNRYDQNIITAKIRAA